MKTILVLYERLSRNSGRGLGFASYSLARALEDAGLLEKVYCLDQASDLDLPPGRVEALKEAPAYRMMFDGLSRLGAAFPRWSVRRRQESLFDRFVARQLKACRGRLLFCSRPLFRETVEIARSRGCKVWIQSSVPHPLRNFALVRHEEIRLGLDSRGAYSDLARAERMARIIGLADKVVTIDPAIGRSTYESYLEFLGPDRLLPLKEYFSIDADEFADVAASRQDIAAGSGLTFLHLSHINLIKGVQYLLEAWRRFYVTSGKGCRLVLAGRIDENVERVIQDRFAGLPGVEFRGFVPDLKGVLTESDVFVSCSIADAGPATIIEAMSAGLPVISSRNCGFASLITEGEDGYTYRYNDVEKLVRIMTGLANEPNLARTMGARARRKTEKLSAGRYAQEILNQITDLSASADIPDTS